MIDFSVCYDDGEYKVISKVYSVDCIKNKFLVYDDENTFHWININDCRLVKSYDFDNYDWYL